MASYDEEKTLDPTPHRREQFRKEGRFARSRDAGAVLGSFAALGALLGTAGAARQAVTLLFERSHGDLTALLRGEGPALLTLSSGALAAMAVPVAVAATTAGVAAAAAQAGIRFDTEPLAFRLDRLDPMPRLKELLSPKTALAQTGLAAARVAATGYVTYLALRAEIPDMLALTGAPVAVTLGAVQTTLVRVMLKVLGVLAVLSVVDYAHNRFVLEKSMKMSLKELKEEMKSQDGDPAMKAKMRGRARAKLRQRMMNDVKKADVVVTNPTHVSVALRYAEHDAAPVVVAKGHDDIALQIRALARRHGIPILENRALARALDADIAIGKPISGDHFLAVAQVLAYVYRLKGRTARA